MPLGYHIFFLFIYFARLIYLTDYHVILYTHYQGYIKRSHSALYPEKKKNTFRDIKIILNTMLTKSQGQLVRNH